MLDAGPNTAPLGQSHLVTAVEDTSFRFAAADFPYSDAESNALVAVKIDTIPVVGNLTLLNPSDFTTTPVDVGQLISMADISAGNLRFQGASNDRGAPYATFTFQVKDNGGTAVVNGVVGADLDPTPRTQTINVLNVNDPPWGADGRVTIPEDNQYQFSASDFGFSDPNDSPLNTLLGIVIDTLPPPQGGTLILNHTVVVSAGILIAKSDLSGLIFTPAANAYGSPLATFTFRVKDSGGTGLVFGSDGSVGIGVDTDFNARTMAFSVTPVNDAPLGMNRAVTTAEDTAYTFATTDFGFSDPSDLPMPDTFAAVKITTLPASGALMLNGALLAAGAVVPVATVNAGQLKFVPFPSASGPAYASFTFQVQDSGITANGGINLDPTPKTISISVLSVNDPPASKDATVSYVYGGGGGATLKLSSFSFTDLGDFPENSLAAVKITTLPAGGVLTDGGNAVVAGQVIAAADFTSGLVHYQPTVVGFPFQIQDSFQFQVEDDGGIANGGNDLDPVARTLTLAGYIFIGDPPVAAVDRTLTLPEDHVYTFGAADFDFTGPQDGSSVQSITITSLPPLGVLRVMGAPAPIGMVIPASAIQQGNLQFTPNANFNGLTQFGAAVQDSAGSRDFPYAIGMSVLPVNDAPVSANPGVTATEDTTYTFGVGDFGFSDFVDSPANNFYTVRIVALPSAGLLTCGGVPVKAGDIVLAYDIAAGKLKFTPAANGFGPAYTSLSFRLQDDGGTANGGIDISFTPSTLTLNVTPVNDPPVGMNTVVAVQEDTSYVFGIFSFGFSDANDLPLLNNFRAVEITTLPDKGTLTINGTAVVAGQFITAADLNAGNLRFAPAANATASPYTSFTFQVEDDGGTMNGGVDLDPVPKTLTINVVRSPCQAPFGSNQVVTTLEDTLYAFRASDFPASFCSDGLSVIAVRIISLPAAGTLRDNGALAQVGQFVTASDLSAGKLIYTPPPDLNGSPLTAFTFEVEDDGGTAGGRIDLDPLPRTLTINVQPVNDPPEGANTTLTTLEDMTLGFSAANFAFNDVRDNPTPNSFRSLIITSLPTSGALKIGGTILTNVNLADDGEIAVGNLSQLTFTPGTNDNDGNTISPSFTFKVRDNGGTANGGSDTSFSNYTAAIRVSSVNDAPMGIDETIALSACSASYVLTLSDFGFMDPNDSPANSFQALIIVRLPASGSLLDGGIAVQAGQMIPASDLAAGRLEFSLGRGSFSSDSFQFLVQDSGGTAQGGRDTSVVSNTLTFFLVPPPLRPPLSIDKTVSGLEDQAYVFAASDFSLLDDGVGAPDGVTIVSVPAAGVLADNGVAIAAGQFIPDVDFALGAVTFVPPRDVNGQAVASFQYATSGSDVCSGPTPVTGKITINVTPVNDPPLGADSRVTTLEDHALILSAANFPFSDPHDSPAVNQLVGVKIATVPATGLLLENGVLVAAGDFISIQDVQGGRLQFIPAANANGLNYASFTFQVKDDGGTANGGADLDSTPRTMAISVTPVNDPPVFGISTNVNATDESGPRVVDGWATHISAGPSDESGQTLHFLVAGNSHPELFSVPPAIDASGKLTFTPAPNASGSADIQVVARDDGGTANGGVDTSAAQVLTIQVTKAHVGHNAQISTDVTGDGYTAPSDVLAVINFINSFGSQRVSSNGDARGGYYDVNGDGFISPSDALAVIDELNALPAGEGEGPRSEFQGQTAVTPDAVDNVMAMLGADVLFQMNKKH